MSRNNYRREALQIGDLVSHYLYSKDWLGVVLKLDDDRPDALTGDNKVLVHMLPGRSYANFFLTLVHKTGTVSKSEPTLASSGWVFRKWLWRIDKEYETQ